MPKSWTKREKLREYVKVAGEYGMSDRALLYYHALLASVKARIREHYVLMEPVSWSADFYTQKTADRWLFTFLTWQKAFLPLIISVITLPLTDVYVCKSFVQVTP